MKVSSKRREQQELEADLYAWHRGHGAALASALSKLGSGPEDALRIRLLSLNLVVSARSTGCGQT